ncbi:MAG: DUF808 domain-containing protein [Phycisphaerae bacterium]|nr:DUF808 domain-containing protein [Gemmatimonadaceae bacterium]
MMASSLLALIDDISTLLDDVAVLAKVAAKKTAGVMGDDLALNAQQVSGVKVDRELPVVWAVAKGSFINKLILVPAALAISAFFPVAIMPLMMIGGLFLCYEGFEKVAHKVLHSREDAAVHHKAHVAAVIDPAVDLVALEKEKIKGAIRTDFILSAEIIVITLGTMSTAPIGRQIAALSAIAIGATVFVYGIVAGIVKLDDFGFALNQRSSAFAKRSGALILRAAPLLMKSLSFLGTAAMFSVGGSILVHGFPPVAHFMEELVAPVVARSAFAGGLLTALLEAVAGIVAGGVAVAIMLLGKRVFTAAKGGGKDNAPAHH